MRHLKSFSKLVICLSLLLGVGCAESGIGDSTQPNIEETDTAQETRDAGSGDASTPDPEDIVSPSDAAGDGDARDGSSPDDADIQTDGDTASDAGATTVEYLACVLGEAEPWSECADPEILDFGTVMAGDTVVRSLRIDNMGEADLMVTDASIADPNFSIRALTFTRDTPPDSAEVALPAALLAGEALFIEVSVSGTGTGSSLEFAAHMLEILVDAGGTDPETLSVEIRGGYGNCATGYYDCDGDASNGCEVHLDTDPLNCGACGSVCAADNASSTCVSGQCAVATCDAGFDDCDMDPSNGCEAELDSIDDCGSCGNVCGFNNASALCDGGACALDACEPGFEDCNANQVDGCEVDTNSNLSNCGGCGNVCALAHAQTQCVAGACELDTCLAGWTDLNGDPSDGCEYQCTFQSANDAPDANGVDANCDGIDGDITRGIFVATTGSDSAAGTMSAPFATITRALTEASSVSGLDHIYVATGQYDGQIQLVNGISIFGGYDATDSWRRNGGATTRIFYNGNVGPKIAVRGDTISSPTTLGMLDIATGPVNSGNGSNYALYCKNCTKLTIQNSTITSGAAGNGQNGVNGTTPADGRPGNTGGAGSCDGSGWGSGGSGGTSSCGRNGGNGGRGGSEGKNDGYTGGTGAIGSSGGSKGRSSGGHGGNGVGDRHGTHGTSGAGGAGGAVLAGYWAGNDGRNGTIGTHGHGGGGGGGGAGQGGWNVNDGSGNGGGGGGGGGCAGTAGTGGQAGGSSFGIFLVSSTGIVLTNNSITSGNAGNGGRGGQGAPGSSGGAPGAGNRYCDDEVGAGGNGGRGGNGGNGGHGGGGAGGHSYGIYRDNTLVSGTLPGTNTIITGQPGSGGASMGLSGTNGFAASY
ncbi:hypothetical protein [Bradymonas sediminis]|nr:hypothetical protein [Bradymonas sediminis]TDP76638.1 hypothetical protein DFR33_102270 [Bradymonas sediminis]